MKLIRFKMASIGLLLSFAVCSMASANEREVTDAEALLVTSGDPGDPLYANAGDNLRTGVGSIFIGFAGTGGGGFLCTASAIDDEWILTAGHCLRNTLPNGAPDTITEIIVVMPAAPNGPYIIFDVEGFAVNPLFDTLSPFFGAIAPGDVALIKLSNPLPADVERYDIYRGSGEFNQAVRHYGHGRSGQGKQGGVAGSDFFYARTGLNTYEAFLAPLVGESPAFLFQQLLHDFDSGGEKHNAMDWWFSSFFCHPDNTANPPQAQDGRCTTFNDKVFPDKGFGKLEIGIAPGDSGGPGFIGNEIAGVHSFGFTHGCRGPGSPTNTTDFTCGLDSSFGEMAGDARVSANQGWLDAVTAGEFRLTTVPELVPAAVPAASDFDVELLEAAREFTDAALMRRLRKEMTRDELREEFGVE